MTSSFRSNCSLNFSSKKEHKSSKVMTGTGVVEQSLVCSRFSVNTDDQKEAGEKKSPEPDWNS